MSVADERATRPQPVEYGSAALIHDVEQFLRYDASLLDGWELADWLSLFTPDCTYLVPATDRPGGDPAVDLFLIRDDYFLLSERVEALITGTAWAESPRSTTHRIVGNVRAREDESGIVEARASVLVHRSRGARLDVYPAFLELHLSRGGHAGFEISFRKATLALEQLRPQGRMSLLL